MTSVSPSAERSTTYSSKEVQYLLASYALAKDIKNEISTRGDTIEERDQDRMYFYHIKNDAFSRCDNVLSPKEVINKYIDGLTPAINSKSQRFCNARKGWAYVAVIQ